MSSTNSGKPVPVPLVSTVVSASSGKPALRHALISGRAVELRWLNAWTKVEFFKSALRTPSTNALGRLLLESSASNSIAESTDVFPTEFAPTSSVNCDR